MSVETEFLIVCIEEYKAAHHLTGREVIDLFNTYDVSGYIRRHYDALHTTGGLYNVADIDDYIARRKTA
ncbi:MAG: DUF3791 domain-containing protein [Treponema sp.]|nr:DUF3791 domain-containing protein [Treponema sp.]